MRPHRVGYGPALVRLPDCDGDLGGVAGAAAMRALRNLRAESPDETTKLVE